MGPLAETYSRTGSFLYIKMSFNKEKINERTDVFVLLKQKKFEQKTNR